MTLLSRLHRKHHLTRHQAAARARQIYDARKEAAGKKRTPRKKISLAFGPHA